MQTRIKDEDGIGMAGEFLGDDDIPGLDVVDDDEDDDDEDESDSDEDEPPAGMQARRPRPKPAPG